MKRMIRAAHEQQELEISKYDDYMQNAVKNLLKQDVWSSKKSDNDVVNILDITEQAVPIIESQTGLIPVVQYIGPNYDDPIIVKLTLLGLDDSTVQSAANLTDIDSPEKLASDIESKLIRRLKKEYSSSPEKGSVLPEQFVEYAMNLNGVGKNYVEDSEKVKQWAAPYLNNIYRRNKKR